MILKIIFGFSMIIIFYVYIGYLLTLKLILFFKRSIKNTTNITNDSKAFPLLSVIIAAYNEEKVIEKRIRNLLQQNYPRDKLEIIIASDGSTDKTIEVTKHYEKCGIKILDFNINRGRATVHNDAVKVSRGNILVFSDADTEFDKNFLYNSIRYFCQNKNVVGCVVGNLIYRPNISAISHSESLYFRFEKEIRQMESELGILATGTGACMLVKKSLWKELTPIDDCDFTTPLDVILQGYKIIFAEDALAYDIPPSSVKNELKVRIRQTSKNFIGTLKRWGIRGWIEYPFVSWGLLSHKILRWFTPFFMLSLFISNIFLLKEWWLYKFVFVGQIIFYVLAFLGFIGEIFKKTIPIASTILSFCIANIGMGLGIIKGILGKAPYSYKM